LLIESRELALRDPGTQLFRETWAKIDILQGIAVFGTLCGFLGLLLGIYAIFFMG
jgi:hypothetical protein